MTVVPILAYHAVRHEPVPGLEPFVLTPEAFESHLDVLVSRGCTTLGVTELVERHVLGAAPLPPRPVVLTFDDGYADFVDTAAPAMAARGLRATLFVTTSTVGGAPAFLRPSPPDEVRMARWPELAALDPTLVEIGAHGHVHADLDVLSPAEAAADIAQSRALLERHLGRPVTSFAYPRGYHGARVRGLVEAAGFTAACAVRNLLSHSDDDPLALARVLVTRDHDPRWLDRLLDGAVVPAAGPRELWRTKGWRAARRLRHRVRAQAVAVPA